jgi:hypothetical protein
MLRKLLSSTWVKVAAVVLAVFAVAQLARNADATNENTDVHLLAAGGAYGDPGPFHALRPAGGAWTAMSNVGPLAGVPGRIGSIAAAVVGGELMAVIATSGDGGLFYAVRHADGGWSRSTDVKATAGDAGPVTSVAAANVAGVLQVVVTVASGGLFHTLRRGNGTWTSFQDVKVASGTDPGPLTGVAAAGFVDGSLQVVAVRHWAEGGTVYGNVYHAVRWGSGRWSRLANVEAATGEIGAIDQVAAAEVGDRLHVVVSTWTKGAKGHGLLHASRSGGTWSRFDNVWESLGTAPFPILGLAAAGTRDGQLHVVILDQQVVATTRGADGAWRRPAPVAGELHAAAVCLSS